jgi:hypothetical protein
MTKPNTLLLSTLLATVALMTVPQLAFALELHVDNRGVVSFYEDGVLGEVSDQPAMQRQRQATNVMPATRDQRIEIKAQDEVVRINVQDETTEAKRLRAQFTTQRLQDNLAEAEIASKPAKRPLTDKEKEYRQKLIKERRQNEDALEVKSKLDATGQQELELQNNAVRAELRGADFAFNPETNTVTLTTPSGQEHELNHLPDQAIDRINAVITVQNTDPASPDVSIETTEEGTLYRTKAVKRKKLFGLFNRDIQTEVVLDDETGEVATLEQQSPGLLGKLLDAFSR